MQRRSFSIVLVALALASAVPQAALASGPGDCFTWVTDLDAQGTRLVANADDTLTLIVAAATNGDGAAFGFIIQPDSCSAHTPNGEVEQFGRQMGLPDPFGGIPPLPELP